MSILSSAVCLAKNDTSELLSEMVIFTYAEFYRWNMNAKIYYFPALNA